MSTQNDPTEPIRPLDDPDATATFETLPLPEALDDGSRSASAVPTEQAATVPVGAFGDRQQHGSPTPPMTDATTAAHGTAQQGSAQYRSAPFVPGPPATAFAPTTVPRPRVRGAGIVWGLLFCAFGVITALLITDAQYRTDFGSWAAGLNPGGFGVVAALALGAFILVMGIIALVRRGQRR